MDTNSVTICGHVAHDPCVRYCPNGDIVASLSIDTECPRKGTTRHYVVLKDEHAEMAREKVSAGTILYVSGFLALACWEYDDEPRTVIMAEAGFGVTHIIRVEEEVYSFEPC